MPRQIEIIIKTTDACNARCAYCSAGSEPCGQRKFSGELATLLLRQADDLIASGQIDRVRFLWHGGEPLLLGKPFFREMARVFGTLPHRAAMTHRLQTNLTLLDEEWIGILEPLIGRDGLGTSLDPFDDVRRLGEGDGYRRRWLANLDLLDRAGWKSGCVYVLHRLGLPRAKDLYWFFRNLRDNSTLSLRVNPLLHVGRARGSPCDDLLLSPGDYGRFLIEITDIWLADRRRLILSPVRDLVRAWEGGAVKSCDLAGRGGCVEGHLGVDPDGSVYNCGRAVDAGGMRFGRLGEVSLEECLGPPWTTSPLNKGGPRGVAAENDRAPLGHPFAAGRSSLSEALDHPARLFLLDREDALRQGRCGDCDYWRLCHGGCPYESHTESEQAHQPTLLCEDYRLFFDWLAKTASDQRSAVSGQPPSRTSQPASSVLPPSPRGGQGGCPTSCGGGGAMIASSVSQGAPSLAKQGVGDPQRYTFVFPNSLDGGIARVRSAASSGKPVILADLRAWSPDDLRSLADFLLREPSLTVPIEPFYSAILHLSDDPSAAGHRSLRQAYRETSPTRCPDLPCATCEAFKFCRGFWHDPMPLPDHCRAWREIINDMKSTATVIANKGRPLS